MTDSFWREMEPQLGWIHRQIRRLGVQEMDLDDVTQEVCIRVYRAWDRRDPKRPLRPWLYAFLFRISSDHRRRARVRKPHSSQAVEHLEARGDPERELEASRARSLLMRALDELPDVRRQLFVLVDIEGYAVTEAAEIMGAPLNTTYTRLRKARQEVADAVARLRGRPAS